MEGEELKWPLKEPSQKREGRQAEEKEKARLAKIKAEKEAKAAAEQESPKQFKEILADIEQKRSRLRPPKTLS